MTDKTLRDQPYFPLYCANLIADHEYRLMSLFERGLLLSMIVECWHNKNVPRHPSELSKFLGFPLEEVQNALTQNVLSFFLEDLNKLKHKEVEAEKTKILIRRAKQSEGGKAGQEAKKKKNNISQPESSDQGKPKSQPEGEPSGSLNQFNSNSLKSVHVIQEKESNNEHKEWIKAFDQNSNDSYSRASKGY